MAPDDRPPIWDDLPDETLLQIISYLDPYSTTRLQLVCRNLRKVCLDDELWKLRCFEDSTWYYMLKARRSAYRPPVDPTRRGWTAGYILDLHVDQDDGAAESLAQDNDVGERDLQREQRQQKLQDLANWDPAFPSERVSWYDEYIQRSGPASVNWFQVPRARDRGVEALVEARGVALFTPDPGTMLAVSPLDDGSVCLWDVKGTKGRPGRIVAKSNPDILFFDGPSAENAQRSKRIDTGVTECVSVNHNANKAFFAVQCHLIEVDLNRLDVVSRKSFEWSVTTLSEIREGLPLTLGTSLGVHLHDFRERSRALGSNGEQLDGPDANIFSALFDPRPLPPYAPLSQPTPISIVHLPRPGTQDLVTDDIFVSGRFTNILHYDRRKFPSIVDSIYSGAMVKSLVSLPYPFSAADVEVRRHGAFTSEQVMESKLARGGQTLIAGGSYKTKGSLEMYGVSLPLDSTESAILQNSTMKNRHTAASSTVLSVMNHGTKILFSDGAGLLKWFERDGVTECRRIKIGHGDKQVPGSLFASMPASDDVARKILSTQWKAEEGRPNHDDVLFWTGERLGLVSFTPAPLYNSQDFEQQDPETAAAEENRLAYAKRVRGALARQANEVNFVQGLGAGTQET